MNFSDNGEEEKKFIKAVKQNNSLYLTLIKSLLRIA